MNIYFKVVSQNEETALVEFARNGKAERVILPLAEIQKAKESQLSETVLDTGIPYGLPFEQIITQDPGYISNLVKELHNYGIWTAEDMQQMAPQVHQAVIRAAGAEASRVIQLVLEYTPKKPAPKAKATKKGE